MSKGPRTGFAPVTITIDLPIKGYTLDEQVTYSDGGDTGLKRKQKLLPKIKEEKKRRGKTHDVPHPDHSEDLAHPSWITNPEDTVTWTCQQPFFLFVDQDLAPCDAEPGAPQNPFGW